MLRTLISLIALIPCIVTPLTALAQVNTFPATGNVGIRTDNPLDNFHVNGTMRWGGYNSTFLYSGQDVSGGYIEQNGSDMNNSKMRIQSSKDGNSANYSQFVIDPEKGFSFVGIGTGCFNVGIGTPDTKRYKLAVAGNMIAESIKVQIQGSWPDYVFTKEYQLPTLLETEKYIKENGHLPGMPSATKVKAEGIDLGEMNARLLQKIEELTLYLIEVKKENARLETEYKKEISQIKKQIGKKLAATKKIYIP